MLRRFTAWIASLLYRFNYRQGQQFARELLADGWLRDDLRQVLLDACKEMPNQAYADGFAATLYGTEP